MEENQNERRRFARFQLLFTGSVGDSVVRCIETIGDADLEDQNSLNEMTLSRRNRLQECIKQIQEKKMSFKMGAAWSKPNVLDWVTFKDFLECLNPNHDIIYIAEIEG